MGLPVYQSIGKTVQLKGVAKVATLQDVGPGTIPGLSQSVKSLLEKE